MKNTTSAGPLSVPLPTALRRRLNRYAAQRQLKVATAARTLLDEKLKELDELVGVSRIEEWQRAQAWASWEEIARGDAALLDLKDVLRAFDEAVQPQGRRGK